MTECDNGGQLEKERPPDTVTEIPAETSEKAKIPARPAPPYKLAGNGPQCDYTDPDDGDQCGYLQHEGGPKCKLHQWEALYGSRE